MRPTITPIRQRYGLVVMGSFSYFCLLFVWFSPAAYLGRIVADFGALLALTVAIGVGGTAITFGLPKLVSDLFPTEASGTPSSIYLLGSFAGTAGAFSLGRGVFGPRLGGWRPLFLYTGVAVLGFAAVWWVATSLAPMSSLRVRNPREADASEASLAGLTRDLSRVFASRPMRWLVVVGVVYLLIVHGLQNWLATVLGARGVAPTLAASITSAFVVSQAAGTLAIPPLSDRLGRRGGVISACGAACAAGVATLLVPGLPIGVPVAGALIVGVGVGGFSPLVRMVPAELDGVGPELTGTAVGLVFAVGELGGFLGPFLIGTAHDLTGSYVPGLAVIGIGCAGTILAGRRLPA